MNDASRRSRIAFLWVGVIAPLAILAFSAMVLLAWMPDLPDPMAIHWGADGVNGYGPKSSYIPLTLGIGAAIVLFDAALALFAHRLPQSSAEPTIGPWSATSRFLGAINLGIAALMSLLSISGAAMQRGLSDAADTPDITGWMILGLLLLGGFTVLGWFLQPKHPRSAVQHGAPASGITLAASERAAWFGTVAMNRVGAVVIFGLLAVYLAVTAFAVARAPYDGWSAASILLVMSVVVLIAIGCGIAFRVRVNAGGLRVRSFLGWPDTRIPTGDIAKIEVIRIDPLAEFGGWGWRIGTDGRRGVVLRAGEALQVTRASGSTFVVTIDGAEQAAALLQAYVDAAASDPESGRTHTGGAS
ncbi:DUF1648 domain-containing protein [Microbacterium sp. NPDC056234]|uniref:DUF1648 domain-containing protein n=1 Tax=Microbacterium sp. NPDC056234 TaxID=3345757 RepID=UPI0035DFDBE5